MKILFFIVLIVSSVFSDFIYNVNQKDIDKSLGVIRIGSLGVGEEAYIGSNLFCLDKDKVKISKSVEIDSDRKYSKYKIKRLSNNRVTIEMVSTEYTTKKERIESFIKNLKGSKYIECSNAYLFGVTEFFTIDSIEGQKTVSDLWNNIYLKQ